MLRILFAAIAMLVVAASASMAADAPSGEVILTITGPVIAANTPNGAEFDAAMLAALPQHTIETTTPWHDGVQRFEGPLLSDIMAEIGAEAELVNVIALDEYEVLVPFADFAEKKPILAMKRNGEPLPANDKGPLFVIYDYDSDPSMNTVEIESRSVWSVRRMELLDE